MYRSCRDEAPKALVAFPNLVIGHVVPTRFDTMPHTQHREIFRDQGSVQNHRVSGRMRFVDDVQLGGVREHGFSDERLTALDAFGPGFGHLLLL